MQHYHEKTKITKALFLIKVRNRPRITALTAQYRHVSNIYIDASAPAVISSVKRLLHDFPADNYLEHIANLEKQYKTIVAVERLVRVLPVSFGQHRKDMLAKLKTNT